MKPTILKGRATFRGAVILFLIISLNAFAQVQQAWVARYSNGMTKGTNQAVKMTLDSYGNIIVTGVSQNTNSQVGYVTVKYAPNGNQLWAARFDSTNYPTAAPSGLALDSSNNVVVTGSAVTVKYDPNGNQLWIASYNGNAISVDSSGNSIVTGFSSGFNTAKLSPSGSNQWSESFVTSVGPAQSEAVVVDGGGNVYVAGWDTYVCTPDGPYESCYPGLVTLKYDSNGNQLWQNSVFQTGFIGALVAGLALDSSANLYVLENSTQPPFLYLYNSDGDNVWMANPDDGTGPANGLALDSNTNVILAGQDGYAFNGNYSYYYTTFKLNPSGTTVWENHFPEPPFGSSAATSVAIDSVNNSYVTGYSSGTNSSNDIVTIRYGPNGNQIWLKRYSSPGNGNAGGNAIAVDKSGNVYVTGYETLPGGGTGIVTIKYAPISIQRQTNGAVLIETQGSPGESFDIQASSDLLNWLDLGTILADTNGLMQFDDTNAPNFPTRFYYTNPQ